MFASKLSDLKRWAAQLRRWLLPHSPAPRDYPFVPSDIGRLQRLNATKGATAIDDMTWKDMLLEEYAAHLASKTSIFGQQMQHQRLREGLSQAERSALGERLRVLMADPELLAQFTEDCTSLRRAEREIAGLLYEDQRPPTPHWRRLTWLLPLLLAGSIAGAMVSPLAWLLTGLVVYLLMATQMRYTDRLEDWAGKMQSLHLLLRTGALLGRRAHPLLTHIAANGKHMGILNRALSRSPTLCAIPGGREYADWFMLGNVTHYFENIAIVFDHRDVLRQYFLDIANFEADLALARHLLATPLWCRAQRRGGAGLMLGQGVHPLLEDAVPLSIDVCGQGAFISGQNGIGKSTLLRTLGLNLLTARAFGFCYAQQASLPALPVYSSMQGEDSLFSGQSLYIAELRRAQELLEAASRSERAIFIIDEIFRGTNHLESVSAAAAVLDRLSEKGLVFAASHHLVLAALLEHRLSPLCVTAPDGDRRRLVIAPGVLAATNGIALLAARGFDPAISAKAGRVFDWLGGHLAHPGDCSEVLRSA